MKGLFNAEGPLMSFLSRTVDLILLNVLWISCSLPIVTFGAATTAVYSVMLRLAEGKDDAPLRHFFKAFAANFKQSTAIWLILLAAGLVTGGDVYIAFVLPLDIGAGMRTLLMVISVLLSAVWLAVTAWVFVLQARFENPVRQTLQNACMAALAFLPWTVLFAGTIALCLWCTFAVLEILPFWLFIGYALAAFLLAKQYRRLLMKLEYTRRGS